MASLRNASSVIGFQPHLRGESRKQPARSDRLRLVAAAELKNLGPNSVVSVGLGEKNENAVRVLRASYGAVSRGWDVGGHATSLTGIIQTAGNGSINSEHARRALRRAIGDANIWAWESHAYRTKREILSAVQTAIDLLGGTKPSTGGRFVSSGPWKKSAGGAR